MRKKNFLLVLFLAFILAVTSLALISCNDNDVDPDPEPEPEPEPIAKTITNYDPADIYTESRSFQSLYDAIGDEVTIADVEENLDTGLAYVTVDGKTYELGMDFLSMAMVYKCDPIAGNTAFDTADEIYVEWWRLYMQRWNYLMPEIPLYSNQYFDVYKNIIDNYSTSPFWGTANAMIYASMKAGQGNTFIIGNTTELSGEFRFSTWGVSNPAASNNDIQKLITGLATVETNQGGLFVWSDTVVKTHNETENVDGSKTFTIEINDDLVFSDGSPITAKNYLYSTLVFSSPVGKAAMNGTDKKAGMYYTGYADFKSATASTPFSGLRLLGDYEFSVTIDADYLPYYYELSYASFSPTHKNLWMEGAFDIGDDGDGVYLPEGFYAKTDDTYNMAQVLSDNRSDWTIPYSGPYTVATYDASAKQATLSINNNFPGNFEGQKPSIPTIVYVKVIPETQLQQLKDGLVNVLAGITGGDETNEALALLEQYPGVYAENHYNRAGYGKLGFRSDFGPASYTAVRQSVAYIIDTMEFAQQFTGGYGVVVFGAYCDAQWMYNAAKDNMSLNTYSVNTSKAIAALVAGGWTYNSNGDAYKTGDGVRYKKISGAELTENNLKYQSKDGTYKTLKIDGEYYMPLVINWFCSENNNVSEMLKTAFANNTRVSDIGMVVQFTQGTFTSLLGELYQYDGYGYTGPAMYSAFNFATGYNSAVYDYSYNWTIDPSMYDDYSAYYLPDAADYVWES